MNDHKNNNEKSLNSEPNLEKIADKKKRNDLEKNKRKTKLSQALRQNLMRRKKPL
jgi:hypothetical protein